jgi:hypothetical protein
MKYTLTIQESHLVQLQSLIVRPDELERSAMLLCGRVSITEDIWDGGQAYRFLSQEVIPIPDDHIEWQTKIGIETSNAIFRGVLKKAQTENLAICLVHSHPAGFESFSIIDDENEKESFATIYKRNGGDEPNLSLILTQNGGLVARACTSLLKYHPIEMIRVMGGRFKFVYSQQYSTVSREEFQRQQLAFGKSLNEDLAKLRIGVVGCGATGSATAHLLARLGVGQILLIDNDFVERTNLNRLYGATSAHADMAKAKVNVLSEFIGNIGIGCRVRAIKKWVGSETVRDAIKSCDVIFGCTDDNSGRIFLNRLAQFYLIPVIDMGLIIEPHTEGLSKYTNIQGRVTVLFPGATCLICRGTINVQLAREENLKRNNPLGYARQKEEAYVIGERNPNPSVITFTTEVATMAVNELLHRITGYKRDHNFDHVYRLFDKGLDQKPGKKPQQDCPICESNSYWGKGDMEPFMDQTN